MDAVLYLSLIASLCGILTYIYHENQAHVGKYTIHGWYGLEGTSMEIPQNYHSFASNLMHPKWVLE